MTEKKSASKPKFNPKDLTMEQQALVVEEFMGCHPKFYIYEGHKLKVDLWNLEREGKPWNGYFKPHMRELGL